MPTAYTYVRFSSGNQAKGSSVARQVKLVSQWLSKNPEYDHGELQFIDKGRSGYSGTHLKYDLGKILDAIEAKEIKPGDAILVEAVDRIGRLPPTQMIELIFSITKADVSIVTVEDNKTYSRESLNNDQSSLFILVGKVQQAHDYSKRLSERVRAGYKVKRDKAKAGEKVNRLTPFWLSSDGEFITDKAEAVKDCINLYLKGYGPRKILEQLEPKHPHLQKIHPSSLVRWFRNRALCGDWAVYTAQDDPDNKKANPSEIIKDVYPPLIDRATFYEIQEQLKARSRQMSKAASYQLSGLCVCGECDSAFYYRRKQHNGYTIIYGNCSNYLKRGPNHCTNNKTWPYEVLMYIHDTTNNFHIQAASEIENDRLASKERVAKEQELDEIKLRKQNTLDLLIEFPKDQDLREAFGEFGKQVETLETEIEILANQDRRPVLSSFFEEITDDSVMLNAALKDIGYQIKITGPEASIDCGGALLKYTILRRSQIYGCYIVHHQSSPEAIEELGSISSHDWDYDERYLAINRNGLLAEAPTDQDLINILRERKSHNDIL